MIYVGTNISGKANISMQNYTNNHSDTKSQLKHKNRSEMSQLKQIVGRKVTSMIQKANNRPQSSNKTMK